MSKSTCAAFKGRSSVSQLARWSHAGSMEFVICAQKKQKSGICTPVGWVAFDGSHARRCIFTHILSIRSFITHGEDTQLILPVTGRAQAVVIIGEARSSHRMVEMMMMIMLIVMMLMKIMKSVLIIPAWMLGVKVEYLAESSRQTPICLWLAFPVKEFEVNIPCTPTAFGWR